MIPPRRDDVPPRPPAGAARRRVAGFLVLFVLAGFGLRLWLQGRESTLATDSFQYLLIARSLASGGGYESGGAQFPDVIRPPGLPWAIAVASWAVRDVETAGNLVAAAAGALIVVPLFFLSRRLFGEAAAVASLPLGAFSTMTLASNRILPTAPFVLVSVAAAVAAWRAGRSARLRDGALAGALSGLAALTRMEGIVWAPAFALWILVAGPKDRARGRILAAATVLFAAAAVYAPYVGWASGRLGRFAPAPGVTYLRAMRDVSDRLGLRFAPGPDVDWTEKARFLMTADRSRLVLEAYFEDGALPEADDARVAPALPDELRREGVAKWRDLVARRLRIAWVNLLAVPRNLYWTHLLTPLFLALGSIGILAGLRNRATRLAVVFLAFLGAASLAPALSHMEGRLLYTFFAFELVACAAGWAAIAGWLRRGGGPGTRGIALVVHVGIGLAILVNGATNVVDADDSPAREPLLRRVAQESRGSMEDGPSLAVHPNFAYHTGRPYRSLPLGSPAEVLAFARANDARSLVLEGERDLRRRPELVRLFEDPLPEGFRLIASAPHPSGRELRLFALDPSVRSR